MSDESVRFTTWLSGEEKRLIDELAKENGTSVNFIVRYAVRQLIGLPTLGRLHSASAERIKTG